MPECYRFAALGPGGFAVLSLLVGMMVITDWVRRNQDFPGKRGFLLGHIGMIIWLIGVLAEIQAQTLDCKVIWGTLSWTGIAFVPTAWAVFLLHYAFGIQDKKSVAERWVLFSGPVLITLMAWTNPIHGLFYGPETRMATISGVEAVIYDHGPLFYAAAVYLYIFMSISTVIVVMGAFRSNRAHSAFFLMLTFVNSVPMAANLGYLVFGFTLFGFDPTPFAFSIVLFLFTQLIFANGLFDVTSTARDLLFHNASNPVLVVDAKGDVISMNRAAEQVFPLGKLGTALANWPDIGVGLRAGKTPSATELPKDVTILGRHMSVQITPMTQALESQKRAIDNAAAGVIIMLNDVTEIAQKNTVLQEALVQNAQRVQEIEALRDDLQRQIMLDPLTGLHNRRGLYDSFDQLKAQSMDAGLVVALLDIDHFKSINDRFGHAAGDRILRDFARALRVHVRPSLPVFRVGGEEFLIIFPRATLAETEAFIDVFRESLDNSLFVRVRDPEQIGFSAGLAQWPSDGPDLDAVMKRADDRLYRAKMAGRGCTVSRDAVLRLVSNDGGS